MKLPTHFLYLRPLNQSHLRLKHYISGKGFINLAFFLFLMGTAFLFDLYHEDKTTYTAETAPDSQADQTFIYFCNPTATISLKAPLQKVVIKSLQPFSMARFLTNFHSLKTCFILKTENPDPPISLTARNLTAFRNYHYCQPDEHPFAS